MAILAIVAAGALSLSGSPARASAATCGDTITADTTLHNDLTNCVGTGLVIGRDNIRLNLNGHTVDGNDADDPCAGDVIYCDAGVDNSAGHSGVTIENGTLQEFDDGVVAIDANHDVLRKLTTPRNVVGILLAHSTGVRILSGSAVDNRFMGVLLLNASNGNEIRDNAVSGSTRSPAVELDDSDRNRVERNVIEGSDQGIESSGGDHNDFSKNVLSHNFGGAIAADAGSGNRLRDNLITDNGDGITVGGARDTEISGNIVRRSGLFGFADTGGFGVLLDGSDDDTVDGNVVVGGRGPAIFVTTLDAPGTSDRNVISRNTANSRFYDAILVNADATETLIRRNTANASGHDGIDVEARGTTVVRNRADRNHELGIEAVPGVIDGGRNHAFGNGNPAECLNIAC
jgi:parallel beta-helix repeat protein